MITQLIGIATLFAAGSILPAATPATTLGAREITPATMAPMTAAPLQANLEGRCGRGPRCGHGPRCASGPRCSRRCASVPRCARRCASVPRCGRHIGGSLS